MHEYDFIELSEEQNRLPSNNSSRNSPKNNQQLVEISSESGEEQLPVENKASTSFEAFSIIYPIVQEYIDQVAEPVKPSELDAKRKRPRRVYVVDPSRFSSLRSRQAPEPPAAATSADTQASLVLEQGTACSPTPTDCGEQKYIKTEYFTPEYWNRIEEAQEPKGSSRKRGGAAGCRSRKRRKRNELLSPETAAAIAAAQLELESGKPLILRLRRSKPDTDKDTLLTEQFELEAPKASATRDKRKRGGGSSSSNMSVYDRRYQSSNEEQRRVANGYVAAGNGLRAGNGSDVEASELQSHQYYVTSSGSNASSGTGAALNGSSSASINHAPAMGTLCNIGNTCYLNSVVYTLRFAPHFLHNLHHLIHDLNVVQQTLMRQRNAKSASLGRNVSGNVQLEHARSWSSKDLATSEQYNSSNNSNGSSSNAGSSSTNTATNISSTATTKSTHQSVSEKLHELYHNLHGNEMADSTEPYHADTLLHAIQDVNATFEGNQQQDAHEFLMCVLNCIRETNQSLIKAIGECPEVIANGYIANPDETDTVDALERNETPIIAAGNGSMATSQPQSSSSNNSSSTTTATTTTKTSFFSRKPKRKDELKTSKSTRLQSPLKDNSPTAAAATQQATANSLFYLNTVDLSGASSSASTTPTPTAAATPAAPAKYSSDDEMSTASLLKDKMRLEERIRELNLNFFNTDFEGIVVLTTKCLSCETITRQKQGMLDISVPVPISGYDIAELQDKPSAYIQNSCITREYFRGDNKYSCNQCTGYTEAIRSISYEVLPRLLVIQLNRFSGGMEKVSTYVPTTFTLPCFCAKCCDLSDANKLHVYKLYSVITHVGATLTVGHYIAYTCFLDLASDYINCPKDRRNNTSSMPTQSGSAASNENAPPSNNGSSSSHASTPVSAAASALASSGTSLIKKMKFGRSKASSSGDMSKHVKQLNGLTSKTITNGIGKLSMNTTCHGVNCCAMRLCCSQQASAAGSNSASSSDFSEESLQNGSNSSLSYGSTASNCAPYPTGYGSTGRGGVKANYTQGSTEPIWYMCDDDKIKAMTQREFAELLSPTRKITITPYLLFYARFDLQPTASKASAASTPPQSSWSNENLQSGLHKI
ncbi:CG15817 [Drosophila busckii]|uniref:CG15817 n=1 Tax=Drosophila busckii TaxID=30019 RepID=A0A0M4EV73_DROBS|nr:ubiquitin carboxyl-terminal hydrolase 1 [Drosophila busckii]XP_017849357.1 ubiquitin carboxyl-terminal hydrolase 1 [Drosophila busckii]XP_017849358.1 ubiquitin carboxyl-terminal hydrolase 1 [Drosophila busckii]ALC47155.1 CG15817 [Drosophila busckii]